MCCVLVHKCCLIHCMKEGFQECCIRSYGVQRVMGYETMRSSVSNPLDGVVLEQNLKRFVVYLVEISGRGSVKNLLKGHFSPSANMAN